MSILEGIQIIGAFLAVVGSLTVFGLLGIIFAAWVWYRRDGGQLTFWEFLRGI